MHKIVTGYAPSALKYNFHSSQSRHSHKLIVPRPRLDLLKSSFMYSGGILWKLIKDMCTISFIFNMIVLRTHSLFSQYL